ncbi:SOH1-domain-containing protein [Meredithblackwellia eburnea MCA 4105]
MQFVQCLANPFYLQSLAQQGLFNDEAFLNYLKYLEYWHKPQFTRFIQYPQSLHHLKLLNHPSKLLIEALTNNQNVAQDLAVKQLAHWAGWREIAAAGPQGVVAGGGGGGGVGKVGNGTNGNVMHVDE